MFRSLGPPSCSFYLGVEMNEQLIDDRAWSTPARPRASRRCDQIEIPRPIQSIRPSLWAVTSYIRVSRSYHGVVSMPANL